jgi:purine-nucleoside phosphorylase
MSQDLHLTADYISKKFDAPADTAVILGSGLGEFTKNLTVHQQIPYSDIPGFPVSTVKGHGGNLVLASANNKPIIVMQGRFHYYEGYAMEDVVYPVRVMNALGIKKLILTNASGGVNPSYKVGDIMVINDHINLMGENPLRGINDSNLGPRFPDMSAPYDSLLINEVLNYAETQNIRVHSGVYAGVTGPCYETRAEYQYIRFIGADAVGMSTVPEVITARHMGMRCCGISVITDLGGGEQDEKLTHNEVVRIAGQAGNKVSELVSSVIHM